MKLVDMKMPKKSKEEMDTALTGAIIEQDKYPWGLHLTFEKDQVDKLPILKSANVGDKVIVIGEATVTSKRTAGQTK